MNRRHLTQTQLQRMIAFVDTSPNAYVGEPKECKRFLEGVHWIGRTGAPWRDLPRRYGRWNSVFRRFARWCNNGVWDTMHQHFVDDPDMEQLMLDSTVVRAHACAAGAQKKHGGQDAQALGRSKGGFSYKVHVAVDSQGAPLRITLTAGQRHDVI